MTGSGYALWASHVIFKSCGLTQPMANVVLFGGAKIEIIDLGNKPNLNTAPRKTEGPRAYARYMGSSARAEWPTFLPS